MRVDSFAVRGNGERGKIHEPAVNILLKYDIMLTFLIQYKADKHYTSEAI